MANGLRWVYRWVIQYRCTFVAKLRRLTSNQQYKAGGWRNKKEGKRVTWLRWLSTMQKIEIVRYPVNEWWCQFGVQSKWYWGISKNVKKTFGQSSKDTVSGPTLVNFMSNEEAGEAVVLVSACQKEYPCQSQTKIVDAVRRTLWYRCCSGCRGVPSPTVVV